MLNRELIANLVTPSGLKEWHLYNPEKFEVNTTFKNSNLDKIKLIQRCFFSFFKNYLTELKNKYFLHLKVDSIKIFSGTLYELKDQDLKTEYWCDSFGFGVTFSQEFMSLLFMSIFKVDSFVFTMTDVEKIFVNKFIKEDFEIFLKKLGDFNFSFSSILNIETDNYQNLRSDEDILAVRVELSDKKHSVWIEFLIPYIGIDEFISHLKLNKNNEFDKNFLSESTMKQLKTSFELKLGQADLVLKDLLTIRIGDVLVLNKKPEELIDINISNELFFKAKVGKSNKKYAVQLLDKIDEPVNLLDNKIKEKVFEDQDKDDQLFAKFESNYDHKEKIDDNFDDKDFDWEKI